MSQVIAFTTDVATLAVFDPAVLQHRVRVTGRWWWTTPPTSLEEIADGRVAFYRIGKEGAYRTALRVGAGLSEAEEQLVCGRLSGLGVRCESGEVFVGAGERIPGDGAGKRLSVIPDTGALAPVEAGQYAVEVAVLNWRDDDAFYDEDNELVPDAPADFVVLLTPVAEPPDVPVEVPNLRDLLPKAEAKGKARVIAQPRRRRSSAPPDSGRRRRSKGPAEVGVASRPVPPAHVPEEVAPFSPHTVRAAFREVLYGQSLHPSADIPLRRIGLVPWKQGVLRQDIELPDLLKKLTRVREQMRVLEAKVNAHKGLEMVDKVEFQVSVTGVYTALDDLLEELSALAPEASAPAETPAAEG